MENSLSPSPVPASRQAGADSARRGSFWRRLDHSPLTVCFCLCVPAGTVADDVAETMKRLSSGVTYKSDKNGLRTLLRVCIGGKGRQIDGTGGHWISELVINVGICAEDRWMALVAIGYLNV